MRVRQVKKHSSWGQNLRGTNKTSEIKINNILIQYLKIKQCKIFMRTNTNILNKDRISITDFSFCLRLQNVSARYCANLVLVQNFGILFFMNFWP